MIGSFCVEEQLNGSTNATLFMGMHTEPEAESLELTKKVNNHLMISDWSLRFCHASLH